MTKTELILKKTNRCEKTSGFYSYSEPRKHVDFIVIASLSSIEVLEVTFK